MRDRPKNASGYVPGAEFVDTGDPYGMKVGLITRVDEQEMKCDIKIITGGGERFEVDLTQGQSGPRSFWGGIPEVNSLVIIGYRRKHKQLYEAMILGYIPTGNKLGNRFDPFASDDPDNVDDDEQDAYEALFGKTFRYKRLKLTPGDVGGMSSAGAEFTLTKDVKMVNRAGDLFELRDAERAIVASSIHRVENEAGVLRISGPTRRGGFFLPPDIFRSDGVTLKDTADPERYFGRPTLIRFTDSTGKILDTFNDATNFPPVTLATGRSVFHPVSTPGVNFEDPDEGAGSKPFIEHRMEITHLADPTQEVREEIDGYQADRQPILIEQVFGTLVGNDTSSEAGLQQYGQLLRPKLWDNFQATTAPSFMTDVVPRSPTDDLEAFTTAGAYLFRLNPPDPPPGRTEDNSVFAVAVSKQGKLFVNIPGSKVETYSSGTKNVSAEVNMEGALKMRLGASTPDGIALHLTLEGGAIFDFRGGANGAGLVFKTHSSMVWQAQGVPDSNNVAWSEDIQGVKQVATSSDSIENVNGAKTTTVNGGYTIMSDRVSFNANSGIGVNAGAWNFLCSGESAYQYAQAVTETIVSGGKSSTILEGDLDETLTAGSQSITVLAGDMSATVPAGDYKVTVGTGGITLTSAAGDIESTATGGNISMTAGQAISMTAALAINLTSSVSVVLTAPQVLFGEDSAALGVCRGNPAMPPGSPSLDYLTGLPLMGSAVIRSI